MDLLKVSGVRKQYEDHVVLRGVDLRVGTGEVVALVGRNGSGKSTLAGIIAGSVARDGGIIELRGQPVAVSSTEAARAAGIGIIEQRFQLDPALHVAEAIFRHTSRRLRPYDEQRRAARRLLISSGIALDPDALLGDLSHSDVGLVETVRLLADQRDLVIIDEVAEDFNPRELDELRYVIEQLTASGKGVLYITHHLNEALTIADRVAVLLDGVISEVVDAAQTSVDQLNEAIFGDQLTQATRTDFREDATEVVLRVLGLRPSGAESDVGLELRSGEVLGLLADRNTGLTQLVGALTGDQPAPAKEFEVWGTKRRIAHPRDALAARIGYLPVEADPLGLSADDGMARNILLGELLDPTAYHESLAQVTAILDLIRASGTAREITRDPRTLSGGQAQLQRLRQMLVLDERIVILNEPTRGLDLEARNAFAAMLNAFTEAGNAVILIATDPRELATYTDRVAVWTRGAIRAVWKTLELGPDDLNGIADRLEEVACLEPIEAVVHPLPVLTTPPSWRDTPGRRLDLTMAG